MPPVPEPKHPNVTIRDPCPWVPGQRRFGIRELTAALDAGDDVDDGGVADEDQEAGEQDDQRQAHPLGRGARVGLTRRQAPSRLGG